MDYLIRTNPMELDSTGYMELGPGKYVGRHWTPGFLFIWEDAFGMAEGIIARHMKDYDQFGTNNIPKEIGVRIAKDWNTIATELKSLTPEQIHSRLNLQEVYREFLSSEIVAHKSEIAKLLSQLSRTFIDLYREHDYLCVLGV